MKLNMHEQKKRFQRTFRNSLGSKIRNRRDTLSKPGFGKESPGDFLSKLWALFGPPKTVGNEGFQYNLLDTKTGLIFSAYSGASGPAYGGAPKDKEALIDVLDDFDELLDAVLPVDCSIEYETGFGRYRLGSVGGEPFEFAIYNDADEFDKAIHMTHNLIKEETIQPWDYINSLLELVRAWNRLDSTMKEKNRTRYDLVAKELWIRSFESIEAYVRSADDMDKSRDEIVPIRDVALTQLEEVAVICGIDFNVYKVRYQALLKLADHIASKR